MSIVLPCPNCGSPFVVRLSTSHKPGYVAANCRACRYEWREDLHTTGWVQSGVNEPNMSKPTKPVDKDGDE